VHARKVINSEKGYGKRCPIFFQEATGYRTPQKLQNLYLLMGIHKNWATEPEFDLEYENNIYFELNSPLQRYF